MIDHLIFNKELYYPYTNMNSLIGKHVHPINRTISTYVTVGSGFGLGETIENHSVRNETIYQIFIDRNGIFFSTGQGYNASAGTVFWKLSDYLNAGGKID